MYLIKSFTLENSNHTTVTFDLFDKEGEPILIESADSNGTRAVKAHAGKEEILERLWTLDLLCDGITEVRPLISDIRQCLLDRLYGHE